MDAGCSEIGYKREELVPPNPPFKARVKFGLSQHKSNQRLPEDHSRHLHLPAQRPVANALRALPDRRCRNGRRARIGVVIVDETPISGHGRWSTSLRGLSLSGACTGTRGRANISLARQHRHRDCEGRV